MVGFSEDQHEHQNDHDKLRNKYIDEDSKNSIVYRPTGKLGELISESEDIVFSEEYVYWLENLVIEANKKFKLLEEIGEMRMKNEKIHSKENKIFEM